MLDCHLQWKEHVNCVNLKISKCIAITYNLRYIFTVNTMKQHHNSLIFSYIDYCLEVWGRTYPTNVNSVYIMHKKAIRRISNTHYNEHTNNYLIELNALILFDLLIYITGLFMHKAIKNNCKKLSKFF